MKVLLNRAEARRIGRTFDRNRKTYTVKGSKHQVFAVSKQEKLKAVGERKGIKVVRADFPNGLQAFAITRSDKPDQEKRDALLGKLNPFIKPRPSFALEEIVLKDLGPISWQKAVTRGWGDPNNNTHVRNFMDLLKRDYTNFRKYDERVQERIAADLIRRGTGYGMNERRGLF